jgi:hypothetical protein
MCVPTPGSPNGPTAYEALGNTLKIVGHPSVSSGSTPAAVSSPQGSAPAPQQQQQQPMPTAAPVQSGVVVPGAPTRPRTSLFAGNRSRGSNDLGGLEPSGTASGINIPT